MMLFSFFYQLFAAALLLLLIHFQPTEAKNFTLPKVPPQIKIPTPNELAYRREIIKNMTLEAWNCYKKYAWGDYSVLPMQKKPLHLKGAGTGATIVSSLSTLHLMNLKEQFEQSREWITEQMDFTSIDSEVHVFRAIVEHIGGFLSAYVLTGDQLFLQKALEVSESIKGAFNTSTGLPTRFYHPKSAVREGVSIHTSRAAYEQPELYLLADLINSTFSTFSASTPKPSPSASPSDLSSVLAAAADFAIASAADWRARLLKIYNVVNALQKPNGTSLIPNSIHVEQEGKWNGKLALLTDDSNEFFYNLIRSFVLWPKRRAVNLDQYRNIVLQSYRKAGMFQPVDGGMLFLKAYDLEHNQFRNDTLSSLFEHSSCQLGALFALAGRELQKVANNSFFKNDKANAKYQWELARNLSQTCAHLTELTQTKLLPNTSLLRQINRTWAFKTLISFSQTNSELAETYFILWRLTGEEVWRDRAWKLALAIKTHLRTPNSGYGTIKSVDKVPTEFEPYAHQDPQLISATFKYLYLTMVEDESVLPLDKWVFNAAGHPLPICGQHPLYPKAACSK